MPTRMPVFFFDFTDPGSYLASHLIDEAVAAGNCEWRGLELRPPPLALVDPAAPEWRSYHSRIAQDAARRGLPMRAPRLVPWTRKAHELTELARERDCYQAVKRALFEAHFVDRKDIGRVDLLVEIACAAGLDGSEAKAVLDVDRHATTVLRHRDLARDRNVAEVPALVHGAGRIEGLTCPDDVSKWTRWIGVELIAAKEE